MKSVNLLLTFNRIRTILALLCMAGVLSACGASGDGSSAVGQFSISATASDQSGDLTLTEGSTDGLTLDINLNREAGFTGDVAISVTGETAADVKRVTSLISQATLSGSTLSSTVQLKLSIDDRPIMPHSRNFQITGTAGADSFSVPLTISVSPTDAPDIYLLAGQSNMVGFSGDGTRQAEPGGFDEPIDRIKQLNVSKNQDDQFLNENDHVSTARNIVAPDIVVALDPLHVPIDPNNGSGKTLEYIGLGLSFAKRAAQDTTADIVLVPAAWSGSSFCDNGGGPPGNWNALPSDNPDLGNTWLFERAVTRTNLAIEKTGGVLRGILWHQGESDANERCAPIYNDNMTILVEQFRQQINEDARGSEARQADSNIPFVAGTMSHGNDERDTGNFPYLATKQSIDDAQRIFPTLVPHTGLSNHDDLTPANGYDCGNTSCIHFGPAALREMGVRYYEALLTASGN